ncbi:MAG TPA: GIY-YIG nuclease family protein [Gemmataceae bacterium]|nr:GIY-YIG nuclease family protein [Gemmataceae bacterium]
MDKAYILREIRRTAEANGGEPLGWRRFLTETGIRQSDWFGIHWARWSDALREAGFEPNELTEGYEAAELLEKIARLALELGRLPTNADLRLQAKREPGFPSDKTFGRLGPKPELVSLLCEHCRSRDEYAEVVRLCEEYAPRKQSDEGPEEDTEQVEIGFVYLIKSGRFYKIGNTNSIGRREYELAIQLPERAVTVHVIRTDDPSGIEAYWHKRFDAKRKNGEWFELDGADVRAFKRRKFM